MTTLYFRPFIAIFVIFYGIFYCCLCSNFGYFLLFQHFNNYLCSKLYIFKVRQPPGADGPPGRLDDVAASFGRGRPTLGQGHQRTVAPGPVGIRLRLHVGRQDLRAVDAPARLRIEKESRNLSLKSQSKTLGLRLTRNDL